MFTRPCRHSRCRVAVSCLVAFALAPAASAVLPGRAPSSREAAVPQDVAETRRYAVGARVRPVLFWVGRDSVGEARLTWLRGPNGERGYELLIGSDPARAPRRINQWGYVREMEQQGAVQVFGLMTDRVDRESSDEMRTPGGTSNGPQVFKVIQATIGDGTTTADVQRLALPDSPTFRELDAVIAQVPAAASADQVPLPAGTHAGFLFAMTSLLRESVDTCVRTGVPPVGGLRRPYVFGKKLYVVTTRSSKLLDRTTVRGSEYRRVISSEFEAREAAKPKGETFRVVYGTEGALREVPIRIVYRPNFWFEAEVVLVGER